MSIKRPCPTCEQPAGTRCRSKTGKPVDEHRARQGPGDLQRVRDDPDNPTTTWTSPTGKQITGHRCTATAKGTRQQCARRAAAGRTVCKLHGGNAKTSIEAAQARAVEQRAAGQVRRMVAAGQIIPVADPLTALAQVAGEIVAFKDLLADQVRDMGDVLTQTWAERSVDDVAVIKEDVRAIVAAYERALDRTAKVLASMVKLDLQGRMVALREDEADRLFGAIRAGLEDVDMEASIRAGAREAIANRLEQVAAQAPAMQEIRA